MFKLMVSSSLLLVSLLASEAKAGECDISGVWQHSAKPATLFVDVDKGEISVHTHEINSESVGLVVLTKLKLASTAIYWDAKMYSAAEEAFVDVQLTAKSCHQLSVSFGGEEVLGLLR